MMALYDCDENELEYCSDRDSGRYDIDVMNGEGYYNSDGMYVKYSSND